MKHLKILGLAIVAALAVMALAGAASASASVLCSTNTNPCTGTKYPSGTKISSSLKTGTTATLTTSIGNVVCKKSTVGGVTTNAEAHGEISSFTFTECSLGSTPCEVKAVNLNYTAQGTATSGGNGILTVSEKLKNPPNPNEPPIPPGASVVCGSFINCTFTSSDIVLDVTGGAPATIIAKEEELARSGGICPSTSKWDAEYTVSAPNPLFIEAS
jgi:hypothetical protein